MNDFPTSRITTKRGPLDSAQIALIRQWIAKGAQAPGDETPSDEDQFLSEVARLLPESIRSHRDSFIIVTPESFQLTAAAWNNFAPRFAAQGWQIEIDLHPLERHKVWTFRAMHGWTSTTVTIENPENPTSPVGKPKPKHLPCGVRKLSHAL